MGVNWNNHVAVCKGYYLNYFSAFDFLRGSEMHFSRNLLLFSEDLQGLNLRITLGLALDNEAELSDLKDLKPYSSVYLPPESYFPPHIH